jgi:TonB family protein
VKRLLAAGLLAAAAANLPAQTRGAELTREQKPAYPESLSKAIAQGNVILIGRIDRNGTVQDAKAVWTTHEQFVEPTLTAVRAWVFRPALKDGKPVEIAANIVFPFRIKDDKGQLAGHALPGPALSELAVFPAGASGNRSAPEGFAIRTGADPRARVEAMLELPPADAAKKVLVHVDAVSPSGRSTAVYEDTRPLAAKAVQIPLVFSFPIGRDWEDGIWMLRFRVDKGNAGTGQFWLAHNPDQFDFAAELKKK